MTKLPSPCIGVCKFRREDHCIGCSMTKDQKALFKKLKKPKHQHAFLDMLVHQQRDLGKYRHWEAAYAARCQKRGVKSPV
jgi:predicted Fe-S protein YdhL (DUF1289 family)